VNQLAYQYLIPTLNLGVRIDVEEPVEKIVDEGGVHQGI
jgi:hypothetical protein